MGGCPPRQTDGRGDGVGVGHRVALLCPSICPRQTDTEVGRASVSSRQTDRQTDRHSGRKGRAVPIRLPQPARRTDGRTAAHAARVILVSRAGGIPGGTRLIPGQTDRQTDRRGPCPAHPAWPRGAPLSPRRARWSVAKPRAGAGPDPATAQAGGEGQKQGAVFSHRLDKRTRRCPVGFWLGEAEPGGFPWEIAGPQPPHMGGGFYLRNEHTAASLPARERWGPKWLWPLGTALTSAIGDKKKVPAGSLPDK